LLRRGIQLRRDGADEAALAVFLEAETKSPDSVRVLLHVATAAQAASKWLLADEYLKKATRHQDDPYYVRYRADIEEVRNATAQRVGQFRAVGIPEGAEVSLNGQVVGTLPMEQPKTVEAGTYVLEVVKSGYYRLRRPVSVPGAVLTRENVALNPRSAAGGDGPDDARGVVGTDTGAVDTQWWQSRTVTWSLFGAGIAAGATTGVALFLRQRAVDHWNDDSRCLSASSPNATRIESCASVRNDIDKAEQVAVVGGVAAVAFLGGALTHWLLTKSDDAGSAHGGSSKSVVSLDCAPGLGSVSCSGAF